ncbi:MAG: hypothetical protein QM751_07285 [Paludibacteraceae bacterium]
MITHLVIRILLASFSVDGVAETAAIAVGWGLTGLLALYARRIEVKLAVAAMGPGRCRSRPLHRAETGAS